MASRTTMRLIAVLTYMSTMLKKSASAYDTTEKYSNEKRLCTDATDFDNQCATCDVTQAQNVNDHLASCNECTKPLVESVDIDRDWMNNCSCTEYCDVCAGPGEYECMTCSDGYCIADKEYRIKWYNGLGQCWNQDCGDNENEEVSTSSAHSFAVLKPSMIRSASFVAIFLFFVW
mmetsp:Transcript_7617/g.8781  ORF Transcript_7617/g.8781 Transcript_7617/m.8781 type:complete len:175 (-) Transcript_7617:183-707(-)|eukprot:CAMPEP_0204643534 /NCGR_PEP_ID=MMETSP0718-20130828/787_1 /ASSEMBLY_ACC=CAM_ASM_000674 /TAXON_ID=230516 /ORGANISM="Chaetoceros curvisetus" /LENGTH=174 /DNA_ID=CAMNT_0051664787 /DNA_START=534 /DNA_END=1058 /DNA_ORIENTATION=+